MSAEEKERSPPTTKPNEKEPHHGSPKSDEEREREKSERESSREREPFEPRRSKEREGDSSSTIKEKKRERSPSPRYSGKRDRLSSSGGSTRDSRRDSERDRFAVGGREPKSLSSSSSLRDERSPPRKRGRRDDYERWDSPPRSPHAYDKDDRRYRTHPRDPRDPRDARDARDPRETREAREARESREREHRRRSRPHYETSRGGGSGGGSGGRRESYYDEYDDRPRARDIPLDPPLKTYQQFLQYQEESIAPAETQRRYEDYKKDFNKKHSHTFFIEHKDSEWFKEKYSTESMLKRREKKIERATKMVDIFSKEFTEGTLKFNFSADAHEDLLAEAETQKQEAEKSETSEKPEENKIAQESEEKKRNLTKE